MNLVLESLEISNFKAITKTVKLDLVGRGPGLHYVRGRNKVEPAIDPNGAGKSTMWDALSWVIYGKTSAELRNTDVRPWSDKDTTKVLLSFSNGSNGRVLERTLSPNSLKLDGSVVSQDTVEREIGLSFEVFTNTILLGQGQPLFFDLPPREKLELFSSVLGLDKWDQRSKAASTKAEELMITITENERSLDSMKKQAEIFTEQLKELKKEKDFYDKQSAAVTKEDKGTRVALEKKLVSLQRQRDAADLLYDGAETELRHLRKEAKDIQEASQAISVHWRTAFERVEGLKEELNKNGSCPTCGQPMKGRNKKEIRAIIKAEEDGNLKVLDKQMQGVRFKAKANKDNYETFCKKVDAANDEMIRLDPQISDVKANLEQLKVMESRREKQENPYAGQMATVSEMRATALSDISDTETAIARGKRAHARVVVWVKGFKEVKLFVLDEVLKGLEVASNALLAEFGLHDWRISYAVERETQAGTVNRNLHVFIKSPHNPKPVRFDCWSGGEAQRLRLLGSFALSDILLSHAGITPNLEILDEPTQHLGRSGIENLVEVLSDRASKRALIIYLTDHRVIESARFASTLTVTREKEGVHV